MNETLMNTHPTAFCIFHDRFGSRVSLRRYIVGDLQLLFETVITSAAFDGQAKKKKREEAAEVKMNVIVVITEARQKYRLRCKDALSQRGGSTRQKQTVR